VYEFNKFKKEQYLRLEKKIFKSIDYVSNFLLECILIKLIYYYDKKFIKNLTNLLF
jgi:hypothetical protein